MSDTRPVVIHAADADPPPGPPTPGMDRRQLAQDPDAWVGWVRTEAGLAGGWHHHADYESYIYVISGGIDVEFGPGGRERVTARAGDFIRNPARMIHREVTPPGLPAELYVVRVGRGPQNVNVDGPEPG